MNNANAILINKIKYFQKDEDKYNGPQVILVDPEIAKANEEEVWETIRSTHPKMVKKSAKLWRSLLIFQNPDGENIDEFVSAYLSDIFMYPTKSDISDIVVIKYLKDEKNIGVLESFLIFCIKMLKWTLLGVFFVLRKLYLLAWRKTLRNKIIWIKDINNDDRETQMKKIISILKYHKRKKHKIIIETSFPNDFSKAKYRNYNITLISKEDDFEQKRLKA